MKVTPAGQPGPVRAPSGPTASEKAIAAFSDPGKVNAVKAALSGNPITAQAQSQAQEHPVANPNNISVEELSAIKAPSAPEAEETSEVAPEVEAKKDIDPQLSKQFAHLAKQTKILRQQQQALKLQEAELKAKEQTLSSTKQPEIDMSKYISRDEFLSNPLKVMHETGLSYDTLTQQLLNTSPADPRTEALMSKQEARIAQLEAKLEESAKQQVEQQDTAYKAAVRQIELDVRALVKNDPNFETVKSTNSVNDVVELITETYKKDGIVMSVEDATTEVENYLIEEAMKLTQIGKIKSRLAQAAQPKPVQETQAKPQTQMKTLTNAQSTSRQLTARERAMLAFNNQLK